MSSTTVAYDPYAPDVQADPYPFYTALRRDAPVYYVESLGAYAVSRHADVRRVMHDHATFSSAAMAELVSRPVEIGRDDNVFEQPVEGSISIVGLDGASHTRLRTIVNRAFTPRHIGELEGKMRATARSYVKALATRGAGDVMAEFAVQFPTAVIAAILGVDPARRADFRRWSEHMMRAVFEPLSAEQRETVAQSGSQMGEYLDAVIAERAAHPGDDMVSLLLRAELEGGALTREELAVFVFTLLVAGSITTAYLIGSAVIQLVQDPACQAAVRTEPGLVAAVAEETLRHQSPVQMMFRTATCDVDVAGTRIPEGATLLPLIGSANRDERVFTNPDRFDYGRAPGDALAFGHGVHYCLGAALARLEARVALDELVRASDVLEPVGALERITSLVFRGPTVLPIRFH
ncbi:MAG: cytochrome P450 [Acidimicrobiia bacterium]